MRVLVTGGNAGIGYFTAEQLASAGAEVVLGSRDPAKAQVAVTAIRSRVAGARVTHVRLDLADLAQVATVAPGPLDAVVCNAGVMLDKPPRRETKAGHELMFGTNHLGHFALVARLMPVLAPDARIVTTGSFAAKSASLDFADLQSERGYHPKRAYERSKLAQMLFAVELDRRLRRIGSERLSVVAHPGGALDSLTPSRPPVHVRTAGQWLRGLPARIVLQGKDAGARPAVRAVLGPDVAGGQLWGPRVFGLRGRPRLEEHWANLADDAAAERLWAESAALTGTDPLG
ncbi:SDR family NAD(P)-dependent oxidoreductase [Amycolatopsis australiensis]|uniref:NAD(P)-dependent dehydrogenase, short-chain alcohol dehydrogenase family n=1 Tax=Amycolatopsis australiensis TaxID=546364 RepID=A0A1K1ST39_9PSEU|nr:SDR family NAD(P)-dependent oxidoreductase [Amycolatopsis australiensis]SFW87489.1 NAD(P)-dependent dehydrogenase, short-chain alcohol dehydrogenase family [Amycolatopsis australiensis]